MEKFQEGVGGGGGDSSNSRRLRDRLLRHNSCLYMTCDKTKEKHRVVLSISVILIGRWNNKWQFSRREALFLLLLLVEIL